MGYHPGMPDSPSRPPSAHGGSRTGGTRGPSGGAGGTHAAGGGRGGQSHGSHAADDAFRHSYTKDKAQLVRRLSRIEGQVRGIARMIEREEYCVDILQQTAALRAAIDAVSILILEDHVQGCVRTAAERGEADRYVDEVVDVVRRTLGRPVRGTKSQG